MKFELKISPHRCWCFRDYFTCMCLTFMLKDWKPSYTPMTEKYESTYDMKQPKAVKECRSFYGMANFLSSFFKGQRKYFIPITEYRKIKINSKWTQEYQKALEHMKELLITPLVLQMPIVNVESRKWHSKTAAGAPLFQLQ